MGGAAAARKVAQEGRRRRLPPSSVAPHCWPSVNLQARGASRAPVRSGSARAESGLRAAAGSRHQTYMLLICCTKVMTVLTLSVRTRTQFSRLFRALWAAQNIMCLISFRLLIVLTAPERAACPCACNGMHMQCTWTCANVRVPKSILIRPGGQETI